MRRGSSIAPSALWANLLAKDEEKIGLMLGPMFCLMFRVLTIRIALFDLPARFNGLFGLKSNCMWLYLAKPRVLKDARTAPLTCLPWTFYWQSHYLLHFCFLTFENDLYKIQRRKSQKNLLLDKLILFRNMLANNGLAIYIVLGFIFFNNIFYIANLLVTIHGVHKT